MSGCITLPIFTVDAFAGASFEGNPAAVCPLDFDANISEDEMQKIAMEMNLSETAYPRVLADGDSFKESSKFGLRWFTPEAEVSLCGHATLATASIIFNKFGNLSERLTFETLSGDLLVGRNDGSMLEMNIPTGVTEPQVTKTKVTRFLIRIISLTLSIPTSYILLVYYRKEFEDWRFNITNLPKSTEMKPTLVIVTIRGIPDKDFQDDVGQQYDFLSRCFAPWVGINEDPVTGSAQVVLAHYWQKILNKTDLFTRQASKRGGNIKIKYHGDRVDIYGKAKMMMEGILHLK
ncbi:hypothetical protein LOTGIDRAFT_111801 [Lottia gigantea]|uniref:Phenazine biosynthesis-like domain-containing protein n=1 Tax=Lottia gigantea TaxID=225164 RepID=V4AVM9_LOTGI|nr:hypothetical protein LOTGIDRAFT_111801 [Lottia gigantea]ESP01398.1 hypothetical protein LOTGIDRAFT_111801 [Lottia gigantea]